MRNRHLQLSTKYSVLKSFLLLFVVTTISGHFLFTPCPIGAETNPNDTIGLESIQVTTLKSGNLITVRANAKIDDYKSFTLENPVRIVFDLFKVKSPYKKEREIPVASEWIHRVRYYGHRDNRY